MKLLIKHITENPTSLMRKAGYVFQRQEPARNAAHNAAGGNQEMSFVRVFGQSGYPRFHCYTRTMGTDLHINLHLDQKKHTYGEGTRHHGEYENDGPVQTEGARLLQLFGEQASIT